MLRHSRYLIPALLCAACVGKHEIRDPILVLSSFEGRKVHCDARDAEGHCMKLSCVEDEESDCDDLARYCLAWDLYWAGTRHGGACSIPL